MKQTDGKASEKFLGEIFIKLRSGGKLRILAFRNKRANYVSLKSCAQMLFDVSVSALTLFGVYKIGFNLLPAARQFIKNAQVKVTVNYQSKSARYRSCRHNKSVRIDAFGAERAALINAEAMLFVRNCKSQSAEFNILLEQGVSSDNKVDFAVFQAFFYSLFFAGGG